MAEQFAFQQRFGQRRAVQADERPFFPRAGKVHRPRDELLAHAAFAANQHRRPAGRRAGDLLLNVGQHGAGADHFAFRAKLLPQLQDFAASLVEVFGQFLLLAEIANGQRHVVGDGQREFQIVWIGQSLGHSSNTDESRR